MTTPTTRDTAWKVVRVVLVGCAISFGVFALEMMREYSDHARAYCAQRGMVAISDTAGDFWCAAERVPHEHPETSR